METAAASETGVTAVVVSESIMEVMGRLEAVVFLESIVEAVIRIGILVEYVRTLEAVEEVVLM